MIPEALIIKQGEAVILQNDIYQTLSTDKEFESIILEDERSELSQNSNENFGIKQKKISWEG